MKLKSTLFALSLLLACVASARAQEGGSRKPGDSRQEPTPTQKERFPWEEYLTRTFAEVVKRNNETAAEGDARNDGKLGIVFSGDLLHSQVRVTYTGTTRKVSAARRQHIEEWAKTFGINPEIAALFETEMLVLECSAEHWVPVQKQVMRHFDKELKKGDPVTLFIMFAGGRKIEGSWNWFFLVNEFQAYR